MQVIDLRSDTITQPTAAMRRAMAVAEVGDDFYREDPTVTAFEQRLAPLLGMPAALLVLSGTMGNLVSVLSHANCCDSIIVGSTSHIYLNEACNVAAVDGVLPRVVFDRGGFANLDEGVRTNSPRDGCFRFVAHAAVTAGMIEEAGARIAQAVSPLFARP